MAHLYSTEAKERNFVYVPLWTATFSVGNAIFHSQFIVPCIATSHKSVTRCQELFIPLCVLSVLKILNLNIHELDMIQVHNNVPAHSSMQSGP